MRTRRFSVALAALSIPLLAGSAFAVANSVSTTPGPQVIVPSRTSANSAASAVRHTSRGTGTDDPAGHDTKVTTKVTTPDDHGNDGAGHDVNDDRGHDGTTSTAASNDGPGHDANDDNGHDGTTSTTVTTTPDDHGHDGAGHDATGDGSGHGTDDGSGSGSSGSGH